MALIKCIECGKEISDKSAQCVYCGCPIDEIKVLHCEECGNVIKASDEYCKKCGCPVDNKKNDTIKKDERTPVILFSIGIIISLASMIIMFLKVSIDFYKSVFITYLATLIPNIAFLVLSMTNKIKLENFKIKSIILLCCTIIYVIVASILYTRFYDEHIQDMNNTKEEMIKENTCITQYNGRWINGKCYYKDYRGRTETIIP